MAREKIPQSPWWSFGTASRENSVEFSHFGRSLNPATSGLLLSVFRRFGAVACVDADASPNEDINYFFLTSLYAPKRPCVNGQVCYREKKTDNRLKCFINGLLLSKTMNFDLFYGVRAYSFGSPVLYFRRVDSRFKRNGIWIHTLSGPNAMRLSGLLSFWEQVAMTEWDLL